VHGPRTREYRRRRARRLFLLVSTAREPPAWYDYHDFLTGLGMPRLPDDEGPPEPASAVGALAGFQPYRALKPFPPRTLDPRRLHAFVRAAGHDELLQALRALRSADTFRHFLKPERVAPQPPRCTVMRAHLWDQLLASGALQPCRPPRLPFSCRLKLVPDRKDSTLARVIPVCRLNDACRDPPKTPTPHLHLFIQSIVQRDWMYAADLKGWFWALEVPLEVAELYFAVRRGRTWLAAVRGLLGWTWMPFIMASVADLILRASADPFGGTARTWIDNLTGAFDTEADCRRSLDLLSYHCDRLGATLHEVTAPAQRATVVGIDFDLRLHAWRPASTWAARWVRAAADTDRVRSMPLRRLWSLVGGAVWTSFAAMLPLSWVSPSLQYVSALAGLWQRGSLQLHSIVAYPRAVRDCVRAVATYLCQNPWRRLCVGVSRPVFSDACGEGGLGAIVPAARGYISLSSLTTAGHHINILEAMAASWALRASEPPRRGTAVPVVVDNSAVAWQWRRGRGRPELADAAFRRAYEWAAVHNVGLAPYLIRTTYQPADAPSRALRFARASVTFDPAPAFSRAQRIGPPVSPIALIPPGWRFPVTAAEFARALSRPADPAERRDSAA